MRTSGYYSNSLGRFTSADRGQAGAKTEPGAVGQETVALRPRAGAGRYLDAMARNPVLLVHGIDDTAAVFRRMQPYLEGGGLPVHGLNLVPNNGKVGLTELARQLDQHVR